MQRGTRETKGDKGRRRETKRDKGSERGKLTLHVVSAWYAANLGISWHAAEPTHTHTHAHTRTQTTL